MVTRKAKDRDSNDEMVGPPDGPTVDRAQVVPHAEAHPDGENVTLGFESHKDADGSETETESTES